MSRLQAFMLISTHRKVQKQIKTLAGKNGISNIRVTIYNIKGFQCTIFTIILK